MRKYALVIFNNKDEIIDRYNLDITTNPTGNGFELELSTISGDLEDIITKIIQKKIKTTFVVNHIHDSYQKANSLANWIQKYSTKQHRMALEYYDGSITKYGEGRVTKLSKTEQIYRNVLQQTLEFTHITPYFIKRENTINITISDIGKAYDYKYPYSYGTSLIENNDINNEYILDIPLVISINGKINNPTIYLLDENGNMYNKVKIDSVIGENETLVINSAQKKIFKLLSDGTEEDYVPYVNTGSDTYLRAKNGKSSLYLNIDGVGDGFKLTGNWRQYSL